MPTDPTRRDPLDFTPDGARGTGDRERPRRRRDAADTGGNRGLLIAVVVLLAVGVAVGVLLLLNGGSGDRDADDRRRLAELEEESIRIGEERTLLHKPSASELAKPAVEAASDTSLQALEKIKSDLKARIEAKKLDPADYGKELDRLAKPLEDKHKRETAEAFREGERQWQANVSRNKPRIDALDSRGKELIAEWNAILARHPEWPRREPPFTRR